MSYRAGVQYTKSILEAAKVMASYSDLTEDGFKVESEEKEAIKEAIFHHHEEETDLSEYDMSSVKMDKLVEEVLEENHMEDTVEVTYETNDENVVTTMTVEMDSLVVMAGEEAAGLTSEQKEELMAKYSQYMSFVQ